MPRLPPLPNFLIIGAQKCATRWLRFNLGKHPDVFTARRELEFFNYRGRFENSGVDGYRAQFAGWAGEAHVGEATPGYMMPRHRPRVVATRIKETIPEVRLLALVRDPIDRASSAMVHHIKRGRLPPDLGLLDFVRQTPPEDDWLGLVAGGWYAASLRPYHQLFGDQLLVLLHDDVRSDPRAVYAQALRHIGADPDFIPPDLGEVVFSNVRSSAGRNGISLDDRRVLYEYFRDDIRKLERMLDRDLSSWRPEGVPVRRPMVLRDPWRSRLARTAGWVEERVRGVTPDQYDLRTSRTGRTVLEVVVRLVENLYGFVALLRSNGQNHERPRRELMEVVRSDPVTAYRSAVAALRVALIEFGAAPQQSERRDGGVPVSMVTPLAVVDQLARGWDLAAATGQDTTIPDDLAESAEEYVHQFGPDGPVPAKAPGGVDIHDEKASPTERFVAASVGILLSEQYGSEAR